MTASRRNDPDDSHLYDKYAKEYDQAVDAITKHGSGNITYNPLTGSYKDFEKPEDVRKVFEEFTDDGMPVYVIGVTNNEGDFDRYTKEAYVILRMDKKDAVLGQWIGPLGATYRDVALVLSGISREQALNYKTKYDQQSIVVIQKNGPPEFI